MSACAICQRPITGQQKFVLTNTAEVAHTRCFQSGRMTVGQRRALETAQQEARIASIRSEITHAVIDRDRAQDALARAIREADDARREARTLRREIDQQRTENTNLQRMVERIRSERDAARREAALHQQLGTATPGAEPTQQAPEDKRDATEIRMSLLDLS